MGATVLDGSKVGMHTAALTGPEEQSYTGQPGLAVVRGSAGVTGTLCRQVEKSAIVAAGAVLTPNKTVPSGQIWAGNPAKYLRDLDKEESDFILQSANNYAALAAVHSAENAKTFEEIEVGGFSMPWRRLEA